MEAVQRPLLLRRRGDGAGVERQDSCRLSGVLMVMLSVAVQP